MMNYYTVCAKTHHRHSQQYQQHGTDSGAATTAELAGIGPWTKGARTAADEYSTGQLHKCIRALAALVQTKRVCRNAGALDDYANVSSSTRNVVVAYYAQLMAQQFPFFDDGARNCKLSSLLAGSVTLQHKAAIDSNNLLEKTYSLVSADSKPADSGSSKRRLTNVSQLQKWVDSAEWKQWDRTAWGKPPIVTESDHDTDDCFEASDSDAETDIVS
jgi:hypothetical protein